MFTCFIRYKIQPDKLDEFREYAQSWISLIRKYGGTHHGYFIPAKNGDILPDSTFSFPGLGTKGPPDVAVALFSFSSIDAYDKYRRDVAEDEDAILRIRRHPADQHRLSREQFAEIADQLVGLLPVPTCAIAVFLPRKPLNARRFPPLTLRFAGPSLSPLARRGLGEGRPRHLASGFLS